MTDEGEAKNSTACSNSNGSSIPFSEIKTRVSKTCKDGLQEQGLGYPNWV
jgi:hypothetical protein